MVKIPEPLNHTVIAIWNAYEKTDQGSSDNGGIPVSTCAHECDRNIWYALRWAARSERFDGVKLRRFATGNIEEERLLDDLRNTGAIVEATDPATGSQFRIALADGWLRGKADAVASNIVEAPKTQHVIECKSHNEKSFKELQKKKLKEGKVDHYAQCQLYMAGLQLTRCLYLAVNKNTDEIYAERIEYDSAYANRLINRAQRIVASNKAPGKISEDPAFYLCQWCFANTVCHHHAFARKNCRTCLSLSLLPNYIAYCTFWERELDFDAQQKGCEQHLYLPDLVPGEQTDANLSKRTVTYTLHDNSTWVDGPESETVF